MEDVLGPEASTTPAPAPTPSPEQRQAAIDEIVTQQTDLAAATLALADARAPLLVAHNKQVTAYNKDVAAANARGGATPAELAAFEAQRAQLDPRRAAADIEAALRPQNEAVQDAKGRLRVVDLAFATASGNPEFADDLRAAGENLDKFQGLDRQLAASTDPGQDALTPTFDDLSGLADLNYDAVRDRPMHVTDSFIAGLELPSSGLPDVTYAQAAGIARDRMAPYLKNIRNPRSRRASPSSTLTSRATSSPTPPTRVG